MTEEVLGQESIRDVILFPQLKPKADLEILRTPLILPP